MMYEKWKPGRIKVEISFMKGTKNWGKFFAFHPIEKLCNHKFSAEMVYEILDKIFQPLCFMYWISNSHCPQLASGSRNWLLPESSPSPAGKVESLAKKTPNKLTGCYSSCCDLRSDFVRGSLAPQEVGKHIYTINMYRYIYIYYIYTYASNIYIYIHSFKSFPQYQCLSKNIKNISKKWNLTFHQDPNVSKKTPFPSTHHNVATSPHIFLESAMLLTVSLVASSYLQLAQDSHYHKDRVKDEAWNGCS